MAYSIRMKRTITPELLDSEAWTAPELDVALADLRRINRWFGGVGTMTAILERVARRASVTELTFLDVGGASGDVAQGAEARLAARGIKLHPTILDRSASHLSSALPHLVGDATALPVADEAFDVVGCSLLAHHLTVERLRHFVEEGLRVARVAVVINDLRRSPAHLALVHAGLPLFRSPLTRNDGPASVRAAYTPDEICAILKLTSAARVEAFGHYLYRMGVIAWKR